MINRRFVFCLGLAQLISWGITFYLVGAFGEMIAVDLGWSREVVYGGFAVALLVMGVASPLTGRLIDRHGGRGVMIAGSFLAAAGCIALSRAHSMPVYFAAWICLGLAMRLTLYDAAFAALARIGGPEARRPIAQITLLGGLASTILWPVGHMLAEHFGWRGAILAYAGFALLTVPLHLTIPQDRYRDNPSPAPLPEHVPLAAGGRDLTLASGLFATIVTCAGFLNAGMSSHMIGILTGLGLAATTAVWTGTLRGIGQSLARLGEVLFGHRLHPLTLNLFAAALPPLAFASGLFSGRSVLPAIAFAFIYGAGTGLMTITRGTLPLVLFDYRSYGAHVGRLIAPGMIVSATAPYAFALVIDHFGEAGALWLSIAVAVVSLVASAVLKWRFGG